MENRQTFMYMVVYYSSFYCKTLHFRSKSICFFVLIKKTEVTINQCVNKQSITCNPLFVPPVTGWLLGNHKPVRRTLIFHPYQRFFYCILQKIIFACYFSENTH